jgi:hypothetical protein
MNCGHLCKKTEAMFARRIRLGRLLDWDKFSRCRGEYVTLLERIIR